MTADPLTADAAPAAAPAFRRKSLLLISALLLPLSAVTAVVYGALRSAGDVVMPMAYSIATSVLVLLPGSWLCIQVLDLGVAGIFWALVAAEAVKAALLLGRWLRGRWARTQAVVEAVPQTATMGG